MTLYERIMKCAAHDKNMHYRAIRENSRLRPLIEALAECVESASEATLWPPCTEIRLLDLDQALARLEAEIERMEK
jgi:hypothetical protein